MNPRLSMRPAAGALFLGLSFLLASGCAAPGPARLARLKPRAVALSREALVASVRLQKDEKSAHAVVGVLRQAKLTVLKTTVDIPMRVRKGMDEIVVVLDGEGVSEVNGVRDRVSAGHVIVLPRKTRFQFQTRGKKPVSLLSILVPRKVMKAPPTRAED